MAKSIFISMILALQCFLTGCSTVHEDPFIGVDNLSLDDVRALLSKELTVNELYEKIGHIFATYISKSQMHFYFNCAFFQ